MSNPLSERGVEAITALLTAGHHHPDDPSDGVEGLLLELCEDDELVISVVAGLVSMGVCFAELVADSMFDGDWARCMADMRQRILNG